MTIKDLNESYILVQEDDYSVLKKLQKTLSPLVDGYQWNPKFRAGIWDGRINFFTKLEQSLIQIPKGLKSAILGFCKANQIEVEYEKDTYENITEEEVNSFIESLKIPFEPYDYQKKAVLDSLNKGRLINESATGSGKSLIIYILTRYFLAKNKSVFIIVPNIMLVNQIFEDFISYGYNKEEAEENVQRIGGEHKIKEITKPVCISTWQSQYRSAQGYENIDCLIIDECQSVKGNESVLGTLIIPKCSNAKYRFGFTGTMPNSMVEKMSIISCLGRTNKVINAQGLINAGLATPVFIKTLYLNYPEDEREYIRKFNDYHKEEKFITEHQKRNSVVSKLLVKIAEKGNTLALHSKIAHGDLLLENIVKLRSNEEVKIIKKITSTELETLDKDQKYYFKGKITEKHKKIIEDNGFILDNFKSIESLNVFCITGEVSGVEREYVRQILEEHNDAIILGSYQCMSTGINIKKLHNLVFCSSIKSSITLLQSIGRVMRLHKSKNKVNIWDIVDNLESKRGKENYFLKHFKERLGIYLDSGYPIEEKEINL